MRAKLGLLLCLWMWVLLAEPVLGGAVVTGELKQWHAVTITFDGPASSETASPNPFTDYRLDVTFTKGTRNIRVPGYFAADGNAGQTGAASGNKWRVHFTPDETGTWSYVASFRQGMEIAMSADPAAGTAVSFNAVSGSFSIAATDKAGRDHRGKGLLKYVGEHYLRFANGEWFIKIGPDSPESFLANPDIDGSTTGWRSEFNAHGQHWVSGDPVWQGSKGKNVVGAINYIASKGMNCFYLPTYTGHADTQSVWPYPSVDERFRFDCSKLDQWEILFTHMDRKGILIHLVLSETENESFWEVKDGLVDANGNPTPASFGKSRKLYYRELIARFSHHLAVIWNIGEENGWNDNKGPMSVGNTDAQRKAFADFIRAADPYKHPIVAHNLPGQENTIYTPLLNHPSFEGTSFQLAYNNFSMRWTNDKTREWVDKSRNAGKKWYFSVDEPGHENFTRSSMYGDDTAGVRPDTLDASHDDPRKYSLWGLLMGGGGGYETYFGWAYRGWGGGDGYVNNYAAWDGWWNQCRYAHEFFIKYLPFPQMLHDNALTDSTTDYVFAKRGDIYAVYLRDGGSTNIDLSHTSGSFEIKWYDPRNGGTLLNGTVATISGGGIRSIGMAPSNTTLDWACLIRRISSPPTIYALSVVSGSGSGSYTAGTVVSISANAAPAGKTFDRWTGATVANATSSSTTLTMPAASTTVTATYKDATSTQKVASFTLINADTNTDIGLLADGMVLDYSKLPTRNLNVRANTDPAIVGSVRFALDSNSSYRVENGAPYALTGDANGDYSVWTPALGTHTLSATPFSAGNASGTQGQSLTVSFSVMDSPPTYALTVVNGFGSGSYSAGAIVTISANSAPAGKTFDRWTGAVVANASSASTTLTMAAASTTVTATYKDVTSAQKVTSFTLVNADTEKEIALLTNGMVLDYSKLPTRNLNVRANTDPTIVGSVRFALDSNSSFRVENGAPYTLAGDLNGDYFAWTLVAGTHTLSATPFSSPGAAGTPGQSLTVSFSVVDPPVLTSGLSASPNPAVVGQSVVFSAAASDPNGDALAYTWAFGDGASGTGPSTTHVYTTSGTYTATVTVSDGKGGSTIATAAVVVSPPPTSLKINFQTTGAPTPSGYLADTGAVFGNRNGYAYGWNSDNSLGARERLSPASPDKRYDTLAHMQMAGNPSAVWEIAVPSGSYTVRLVCGDPSYFDSTFRVKVEGVLAVDATPTSTTRWIDRTVTVNVSDGRLTISNAIGAVNNKLCFVEIMSASVSAAPRGFAEIEAEPQFVQLNVVSAKTSLNFNQLGGDSLKLQIILPGTFDLAALAGSEVGVDVGGVTATFTLDARGRGKSKFGVLVLKNERSDHSARALVALTKGNWLNVLADSGVGKNHKQLGLTLPVAVTIGDQPFGGGKPAQFTNTGRNGKIE
ncbi:MAG TPA: DUF5060 domain-containing protein [Planctomycetota bacterium]|nr:DUF5060 domain-containing protein [Planctomycetota bacterium]